MRVELQLQREAKPSGIFVGILKVFVFGKHSQFKYLYLHRMAGNIGAELNWWLVKLTVCHQVLSCQHQISTCNKVCNNIHNTLKHFFQMAYMITIACLSRSFND